jgi:hypothetical protein
MAPSRAAGVAVSGRFIVRIVISIAILLVIFAVGRLCFFRVDNSQYAIVT